MTNFNFKGAFATFTPNKPYQFTGNSNTSYFEGQLGLVVRPCMPLSIHIGAGFAYRSLNYETDQGWYNLPKRTYYGPTASFGFMFHIKGFVLSVEATGMNSLNPDNDAKFTVGAKMGIGFCLPNKRKDTNSQKRKE